MNKFTRHSKRIRITYIVSAMIIILVMAIAFPWFRMPEEDDKLYEVSVMVQWLVCVMIRSLLMKYILTQGLSLKRIVKKKYI